jgi:hypothetical protein
MRQYIDGIAAFFCRDGFYQRQPVVADAATDIEFFTANVLGFLSCECGELFCIFSGLQAPNDTVDRPVKVYRCRSRFQKSFGRRIDLAALQGRKIEAPGGRSTNEWRPAHIHVGNGFDAIHPGVEIMNPVVVRKQSLINNLYDRIVVRTQPDGAKFFGTVW